jgi:type II secretory pathway predicted ATPase ExeA
MDMNQISETIHQAVFHEPPSGTTKSPFHNAPDPDLFFGSTQHQQALETLVSALRTRRGLFLLMGEIGTGKTTLCRYLQRTLPPDFRFGQISNPFVSPREFEDQILRELGLADEGLHRDFFRTLGKYLLREHQADRTVVLLIDEGHLISLELFDHILILSNIQHDGVHLLQIILAGQPELQEILKRPRFASLNQRISTRIFLTGLNRSETGAYIRHRLSLVPTRIPVAFMESAIDAVWKGSGGIPRLINHLCARVLDRNFEENGGPEISKTQVRNVLNEPLMKPLFPKLASGPALGFRRFLMGLGAALVLSLLILVGLTRIAPDLFGPEPVFEVTGPPQATSALSALMQDDESEEPTEPVSSDSFENPEGKSPEPFEPAASEEGVIPDVVEELPEAEEHPSEEVDEPSPAKEPEEPVLPEKAQDPAPEPKREPVPQVAKVVPPAEPTPPRSQPRQPAVQGQDVRINAIVWHADPAQRMAVINGAIVKEGRSTGGVKVITINRDDVELEQHGIRFSKGIQINRRDLLQTIEE